MTTKGETVGHFEYAVRNANGGAGIFGTLAEARTERARAEERINDLRIDEPQPPAIVGIFVRRVGEWTLVEE